MSKSAEKSKSPVGGAERGANSALAPKWLDKPQPRQADEILTRMDPSFPVWSWAASPGWLPVKEDEITPMNKHRALIQGTFRRTSLLVGLAATLLSGCKSYYMWDHPWVGMDSGACGCESSTVISRSSPIGSERISPVPIVSEPPLATGTTLKSVPSSQGPVLTPTPTQVPLNSSSGK